MILGINFDDSNVWYAIGIIVCMFALIGLMHPFDGSNDDDWL